MGSPSYAESLAKDRDKFRKERNILAAHLEVLLAAYSGGDPARDAPILKDARSSLTKIFKGEKTAEELLGL